MREFLSDHLKATRDSLKTHAHGGKMFSSDEIIGLVKHFDFLTSKALLMENQLSRHQWNEAARRENQIEQSSNVVFFTGVRRERLSSPDDGGDAA